MKPHIILFLYTLLFFSCKTGPFPVPDYFDGKGKKDHFLIPVKTHILKDLPEKQREQGQISVALRELDARISKEDNPIFLVGRCKD